MFRGGRVSLLVAVVAGVLVTRGESLSFSGLSDLAGRYEGVDRMGHAFYMLKLGSVGKIPAYAYWSSAAKVSFPLLGAGWDIPLLSSRIYPITSNCLKLHLPDGYVRHFHRGKDGVYRSGRFWTASIEDSTTRVVADSQDGYPKTVLVFFKGRLTRMDCAEGVFDFKYDPRIGWTVYSKGAKLLAAAPDAVDQNRFQIKLGNVRLTGVRADFDVVLPPQDEESQPQHQRASCLQSLSFSTGERHDFAYGVESVNAWFEADRNRLVWSSDTQQAVSWKDCSFAFGKKPKDGVSGPRVTRTDASGRQESHAYDVRTGMITEEGTNGVTVVTRLFTSGDNAGKVRWRERHEHGRCVERVDYIYDGAGRLVDRLVRESRN